MWYNEMFAQRKNEGIIIIINSLPITIRPQVHYSVSVDALNTSPRAKN